MTAPYTVTNPATGQVVYAIDGSGNSVQSGSVTSGDGVVVTKTATPSNPSTGDLKIYTPDGTALQTVNASGQIEILSAGAGTGGVDWFNVKAFGAKGDGTTDDTVAIQAAMDMVTGSQGGVVYFPTGIYEVSAPLVAHSGGIRLQGDRSVNSGFEGAFTNDTVIDATAGFTGTAIVTSNAQADFQMIDISVRGHNMASGTTIGINLTAGGSLTRVVVGFPIGDGIHAAGGPTQMRDVGVFSAGQQTGTGIGFLITCKDSAYTNCLSASHATTGWQISGAQGGDNSTFTACRSEDGKGATNTGVGWLITSTAIFGSISFNQCTTDLNGGNGFRISAATGNGCIQLNGCSFRRDGNNAGTGTTTASGLSIVSTTIPVILDGTTVSARQNDTNTGADGPHFGLTVTGSTFVSVNGGYLACEVANSGLPVNWDGTGTFLLGQNVLTATVSGSTQTINTAVPFDGYNNSPLAQNLLAWTYDPVLQTGASGFTNNTVTLIRIQVPRACFVTSILMELVATGTLLTAAENFLGLYTAAGVLVGTSADMTAKFGSTGEITAALVGGPFYLTAGFYYIAALLNFTGSSPTFGRASTQGSAAINAGTTAATSRYATNTTGLTLPTPLTMSSNTPLANSWWGALV